MLSAVTDRDKQILRLLRWHRVLITSQLHAMFFGDLDTTHHFNDGLARSAPRGAVTLAAGRPSGEYHYVLDILGAYLVAAIDSDVPDRPVNVRCRTDRSLAIGISPRPAHTVEVNDFFVRLIATARHDRDAQLSRWWGEQWCRARYGPFVCPDGVRVVLRGRYPLSVWAMLSARRRASSKA
jgi:hypothetical protein